MARPERPAAGTVTPLRQALVERRRRLVEAFPTQAGRAALATFEANVLGGREVVLDAVMLCVALGELRDPAWRRFTHACDPQGVRRWRLTADEDLIEEHTDEQ